MEAQKIDFMSLKTAAPVQYWGIIALVVLLVVGVIVGTVLASQSCKKNETSSFGNLIDTLKTAAEGTKEATLTIGEAIGITGGSKEEEFAAVGAVDPLATFKLYFGLFMLVIALLAGVYIVFFGGDSKKTVKTSTQFGSR